MVVAQFGGRGHQRAASAYIKFTNGHRNDTIAASSKGEILDETCNLILSVLRHYVSPAVSVGQIMLHHREIIAPTTSIKELTNCIERSNYDSYPIVENGTVVGLLTHRSIERSIINHTLHEVAANLMEAGIVTVYPGDSLHIALMRMVDCNCGQLPVIDKVTGAVLGTISSLNLLKAMYPFPSKR